MKNLLKLIFTVALISSASFADQCRDEVETQAQYILADDLGVSIEEVTNEYQMTSTKTQELQDGVEKYEFLFNTYSGVFKYYVDVDAKCDVVAYEQTTL
ncbi:hypothetical protein [Bacteriovorax sp. Seq25_V]|uniref:hypothetical protein n=1 Tax=Bacteriovorax sp. Seq25_V TaxID=1201288 RepID=UPI000389F799|nr:hypothetical protein [Bacteriovorax sp. Seq25_V]EQC46123.1 hypothetical protein M900_1679 [Bacteriovorax sp. Seq25_V]